MKLIEVIGKLSDIPEDTFICVKRPWSSESEVVLSPFAEDLSIPLEVKSQGYEYFLEVSTAREIIEGFIEHQPTLEQITDFIIFYAENDAYPEWAMKIKTS